MTMHGPTLLIRVYGEDSEERLRSSPHLPYSLDLSPVDYHLFKFVKYQMQGQHYATNEAVQEAICRRLCTAVTEFYHEV